MNIKPIKEPPAVQIVYTKAGDTNLDQTVGFDDLLMLAQKYNGAGMIWHDGDSNYDGSVTFDDLLALAQNYETQRDYGYGQSSFAEDWALTVALAGQTPPTPIHTVLKASLVGDSLVIQTGYYDDIELRASESRTGRLRIFARDAANAESELVSVRASKVRSISIVDGPESHTITLKAGFPVATISLGGGNDKLMASNAANRIYGGLGDDTIHAGGGDDVIFGGEGNDSLFGDGGDDQLYGDAHKDFLDGGRGKNQLIGGQGTDRFHVRPTKNKIADREDRDHVRVID